MQKPTDKNSIDWTEVHRRIGRLQQSINGNWQPDAEHIQTILHERARDLAAPLESESAAQQFVELIEFSLARERYGIASAFVREVYPLTHLTPVPCTPDFVLGIINVRGEIISVIDIRKFFALPAAGLTDLNKVIILHNSKMIFGVLADFIVDVRAIALTAIQPASNIGGIRADYLAGVTAEGMAVIDTEKLLADKNIVIDENVAMT
jgi:purine-binding chemotaxis protein CheW